MTNKNVKMLVEGAMMIALAYVLSMLKIWQMPSGGSVTAGSMIPILVFSFRWGGKKGMLVGAIYGTLQFILGPKYSFHIVSILFDYVVAFSFLGIVGFFVKQNTSFKKTMLGVSLGITLRFIAHIISGVVVFGMYAPAGQSPIIYSIIYNASYLIPELFVTLIIFSMLYKPLKQIKI